MKRIKIYLIATLAIAATALNAQSLSDFSARLAAVELRQSPSAERALAALVEQSREGQEDDQIKPISKNGYRIGIFFDNSATARAKAESVVERCDSLLRDIPTTLSYDNPYFKVSAGYCIDLEEAVMLLHRVQRHFPNAYLMREEINPAHIIAVRNREIAARKREEELRDSLFIVQLIP